MNVVIDSHDMGLDRIPDGAQGFDTLDMNFEDGLFINGKRIATVEQVEHGFTVHAERLMDLENNADGYEIRIKQLEALIDGFDSKISRLRQLVGGV